MARKIETVLVDDIDGSAAVATITFAVGRVQYEIDVSEEHFDAFHADMGKWMEHARKIGGAARRQTEAKTPTPGSRASQHAVREWARENGIAVAVRGRIAKDVVDRYLEATNA